VKTGANAGSVTLVAAQRVSNATTSRVDEESWMELTQVG
jgi:hypothetical protein